MQMHTPYPPHVYFKSLLLSVNGLRSGLAESGKVEWMETHCRSAHQHATVFTVFLIHNPLTLFNAAKVLELLNRMASECKVLEEDITNPHTPWGLLRKAMTVSCFSDHFAINNTENNDPHRHWMPEWIFQTGNIWLVRHFQRKDHILSDFPP